MQRSIFINLPVNDLARATHFYEALGFKKNAQFSDDKAASMAWSDRITFQLLSRQYFAGFAPKPVADAHSVCQALFCLSRDSRSEVDALIEAARAEGGGVDARPPIDMGFIYNRTFEDLDGHVFELVWLNPEAAMPAQESKVSR